MEQTNINYARALYSLALDNDKVVSYQEEVKIIIGLLNDNPGFLDVLNNEFDSIENKEKIIDKIFASFSKQVTNFIKVICKNGVTKSLIDILYKFNSLCNEHRGIIEGLVISITKLDSETLKAIEHKISLKENKQVELINKIDPSILGGVKVIINDHVYDGSILKQVMNMKNTLLTGRTNYEN